MNSVARSERIPGGPLPEERRRIAQAHLIPRHDAVAGQDAPVVCFIIRRSDGEIHQVCQSCLDLQLLQSFSKLLLCGIGFCRQLINNNVLPASLVNCPNPRTILIRQVVLGLVVINMKKINACSMIIWRFEPVGRPWGIR